MMHHFRSNIYRMFLFFAVVGVFAAHGCNCDETIARDDPMSIKILFPSTTTITAGQFRVRIQDLNGVDKISFFMMSLILRE